MEIALIIVAGVVLTTFGAGFFDYLGKRRKKTDGELGNKVSILEKRLLALEGKMAEKDERVHQLETEVSFVNKLIEDRANK